VAFLPEVTSRSCRALVRGADDRPWFSAAPGVPAAAGMAAPLVLGSPGLNDAAMHVVQACLPHRRVLPAGFDSLTLAGQPVHGAVQVHADRGRGPEAGWNVTAVDAAGRAVLTLTGLRLRDLGPLEHPAPWHPVLLAAALESRGAELGLDPALRVTLRCGQPGPGSEPPPGGSPWMDASAGTGPLAGFELSVRASMPVACHWETASPGYTAGWPADVAVLADVPDPADVPHPADIPVPASPVPPDASLAVAYATSLDDLARQLRDAAELPDTAAARLRAITACLAAAGWAAGAPLTLAQARDTDWVQVQAGAATVACTVARIDGVPRPVVIALATWPAPARGTLSKAARSARHGAQTTANGSAP
jgi:Polyketide synthase dehydratase